MKIGFVSHEIQRRLKFENQMCRGTLAQAYQLFLGAKPVLNHEFKIFLFLLWGLASCHHMIHTMLQRLTTPNPRARWRDRRHGSRKPSEAQVPQTTHSATDPGEMLRLDTYKFHKLDWHLCKPTTCSFCRDSASKQERQHHRKCSQWTLDKRSAFTFWTSHPLKCLPWVHELGRSNLKKLEHAQRA